MVRLVLSGCEREQERSGSSEGQMQTGQWLRDIHQALANHFTNLAGARGELPVFAIEHGLDEPVLAELRIAISQELEKDPQLGGAAWSCAYLPLLVTATEVGYQYRGTGTDFWPILARELGVEATQSFRLGLSRLFELGHRSFRLARPGDSPWERHFPHISWPIGNAVVPLEIQPQLADALRRSIRAGISAENTEGLLEHLKLLAAGHASRRFENWLQQRNVALEVMQRLLAPNVSGWLSEEILQRIDSDIRRDRGAHRAITEARQTAARRSARVAEIMPALFILYLVERVPTELLIRGPALSVQLREEVIATLRIHGDSIRVTDSDQPVPLRSFLAGGEVTLGMVSALPATPLRRGDAAQVEKGLSSATLDRLQPRQSSFFLIESGGRTARAVFPEDKLPPGATVIDWRRSDDDGRPEIRYLETSSGPDIEILRRVGFTVEERVPSLQLLGLSLPGSPQKFLSGFPVLVTQRHATGTELFLDGVRPASERLQLRGAEWAVYHPNAGTHLIASADGGDHERVEFEVVEPPDVEPASITILPSDANISDLEGGRLEIGITAPIPLEEVPVRLRLVSADEPDTLSEGVIERLPARITGRSPLLRALQTQLSGRLASAWGVQLSVEVNGLLQRKVSLPPVRRELRYDASTGHWNSTHDDNRVVSSLVATLQAPLLHAMDHDPVGTRLVLPDAADHEALPAGLIISGSSPVYLGIRESEPILLPTLLREPHSREAGVGLIDLARANVGWQLAEATDLLGNWHRWSIVEELEARLIEQLCGAAWRRLEAGINLSILTQHGALVQCAEDLGLVSGKDLPEIESKADLEFLHQRFLARLRETVPDTTAALIQWNEDLAGQLDLAVIDAYEDLRLHLEEGGTAAFDEVDMSRPSETWRKALERARDVPLLPRFRRFILPESRWSALTSPFYSELSEDDLVDLLDSCHVDAFRRPGLRWLGRPELRAMLQLWLAPKSMIEAEDWPRLLGKGLSDVQTSRAVRYVALRRKVALMDLPDWSA